MARFLITTFVTCAVLSMQAAPAVQQGPPPEIRAFVDGVFQGLNGDAAAWEAFAQKYFSADLLRAETPAQRAAWHQQAVDRFGTMGRERVMRNGPDAPLDIAIKGSKASGVISVTIDNDNNPKVLKISIGGAPPPVRAANPGLPPVPVDRTMASDEINRRLDAYFAQLTKDGVFSGVALVAKGGVPVFFKAYGLADREKQIANTTGTRFNIGSINKAFTQIAIRQLIAEGKLKLTDTLGQLFPQYPQAVSRAATIEQLLNHRAGLADFFGPEFDKADKQRFASKADYFTFVGNLSPLFAPGERNQYCNGCYIALGAIVAKVSGMPYEQYLAEKVFARAEMTSTGFPRTDQPAAGIALGYTRRAGSDELQNNIALHGVTGSAAGGSYSTALDLLTFVKALKAGKFPGADASLGIAGGAPGTNAVVEAGLEWTVIVLTNFDPPTGEDIGTAIASSLNR